MWSKIVDWLIYSLLGLSSGSPLGHVLHFFIYDFFKIIFLIVVVVTIITFIRSYISEEKLKNIMRKPRFGFNYFAASVLGAVTPFCSCSGIPIFVGFMEAGVPLGVAIAFLVTSPLVNEIVLVLMANYFGWRVALLYAGSGILLGVLSGMLINHLKMSDQIILKTTCTCGEECDGVACDCGCDEHGIKKEPVFKNIGERLKYAFDETLSMVNQLYKYVFLGVLLGAVIHNYFPKEILLQYVGDGNFFAVPLAVLIGVPIYAGCSTVAPAIFSITTAGIPLGTSLALLMSIAGLSLPEALILKGTMKLKLLITFFGIVTLGIIGIGYLFNAIL